MEITLLSPKSIRIKGKHGSLITDPTNKTSGANGVILLENRSDVLPNVEDAVVISGPGEYELAGIKITGIKTNAGTIFSIRVDRVEVLLGKAGELAKDYTKVKEHNIVVIDVDTVVDPSFVTSLATNVIILYGEKAEEVMKQLAPDTFKRETKYQSTLEKLPSEIEQILLQ